MKKLLLAFCSILSLTVFAQEVIDSEDQGFTSSFLLSLAVGTPIDYNVNSYAVTYTTTDAFGAPDTATGLVVVPTPLNEDLVFPLAVYNHGTVDSTQEVPSVEGNLERLVVQAIAGSGYVTIAPDYLGLGGSDGIHPYLHAATEASAGRDMIIAVRAWLAEQDIAANDQVFVSGYSQGGHASMALHRLLEQSEDGPSVTAAAHLSGGYIIRPPSVQFLAVSEPNPATLRFFIYQTLAYEYVYNLYGGVDNFFKQPYLGAVQQFVAGEIGLQELGVLIDSLIRENGTVIGDIFVDQYLTDILDGDPTLFAAYSENTVLDWAPEQPTLIYACPTDETVNPLNAQIAFDTMTALGSTTVELQFGPDSTHFGCVRPAVLAAVDFFDQYAAVFPVSLGNPADRTDIQARPNPVSAGGNLLVTGVAEARPFVVYDASGRQLLRGLTGANGRIDVPVSLPRGMAVIRVGLGDGTSVVRRIIIE